MSSGGANLDLQHLVQSATCADMDVCQEDDRRPRKAQRDLSVEMADSVGEDASSAQVLLDRESEILAAYRAAKGMQRWIAVAQAAKCELSDIVEWVEHARRVLNRRSYSPNFGEQLLVDLIHFEQVPNASFRKQYLETVNRRSDGPPCPSSEYPIEDPWVRGASLAEMPTLRRPLVVAATVCATLAEMEEADGADYKSSNFENNPITRLDEALGLRANGGSVRLFIPYEWGVALARALCMTPREGGI